MLQQRLGRAWRRHRRKVLVSTALVAGGVCIWRLLPSVWKKPLAALSRVSGALTEVQEEKKEQTETHNGHGAEAQPEEDVEVVMELVVQGEDEDEEHREKPELLCCDQQHRQPPVLPPVTSAEQEGREDAPPPPQDQATALSLCKQLYRSSCNAESEAGAVDIAVCRSSAFDQIQKAADSRALQSFHVLRERHHSCFRVIECTQNLGRTTSKEQKSAAFHDLKLECLARTISAVHVFNFVLLLQRIEANVSSTTRGDEIDSSTAGEAVVAPDSCSDVTAHLQVEWFRSFTGSVREATRRCSKRRSFSYRTPVTAESLEKFMSDVAAEVGNELLANGPQRTKLLLPSSAHAGVSTPRGLTKAHVREAANAALENPRFLAVFRSCMESAMHGLIHCLAPLGNGKECTLARIFSEITELSNTVLEPHDNEFAFCFASDASLLAFMQGLFSGRASPPERRH